MMWNSYTKEETLFKLINDCYKSSNYRKDVVHNFQIKKSYHLCTVDHGGFHTNDLTVEQYLGIQGVVKSDYAEKNRKNVIAKITKVCFV